jgi:hypothetical protein
MNTANGVRIELAALGPDSLQRKAMDSWKGRPSDSTSGSIEIN